MNSNTQYTKLNEQNGGYYVPQQPPTTQYFQQEQPQQQYNNQYQQQQYNQYQPPPQQGYYVQPPPPPTVGFSASTSVSVQSSLPKCEKNGDGDVIGSLVLFILGFFFFIPWIINIMYIKSKNGLAKALAIISVVLFFIGIIATVIYLIVFFVVIDKVIHTATDSSYWFPTQTPYCYYNSGYYNCTSSSYY